MCLLKWSGWMTETEAHIQYAQYTPGVIPRVASAVLASRSPLYLPTTGWTTFPLPSQISPQRDMMVHYIDLLSAIAFGTATFPGTQSLVVTESCHLLEAEGQLRLNFGTREVKRHCVGDSLRSFFFFFWKVPWHLFACWSAASSHGQIRTADDRS